jgi:hypothetical protein
MDSYFKELLGGAASPSINIVDDNVHPSIDRNHSISIGCNIHQQQPFRRPSSARSRSMSEQRRRPKPLGKQKQRITSWSHPDGKARWASFADENPNLKLQRRSSDSVLGQPRRRSCEIEDYSSNTIWSDTATSSEDVIGSAQRLLSSVLDRNHEKPPDSTTVLRLTSNESATVDEQIGPNLRHKTAEYEAIPDCSDTDRVSQQMFESDNKSMGLGRPYIINLKPASGPVERMYKDLCGPPEKPKRRSSEESLTLVAALEAAVAASPMLSAEHSLVQCTHQHDKTKEISDTILRAHLLQG